MGIKILKPGIRLACLAVLMALPFALLIWLFQKDLFGMVSYVLSGRLFADPWDRIHVGTTLDQPTIGKWYFWFSVLTVIILSYSAMVRRFCVKTRLEYWTFMVPVTVLCCFLPCLLTMPFYWLIQYIQAMGPTPARICGLLYGIGGYTVVLGFWVWAIRSKTKSGFENRLPKGMYYTGIPGAVTE
jgi:hypothetical protein